MGFLKLLSSSRNRSGAKKRAKKKRAADAPGELMKHSGEFPFSLVALARLELFSSTSSVLLALETFAYSEVVLNSLPTLNVLRRVVPEDAVDYLGVQQKQCHFICRIDVQARNNIYF